MSRSELYKLKYTIALIAEFSKKYSIEERQAYNYLKRFKGMTYLDSFYDVLHTLSFEDAIETLTTVCNQHGGQIKYISV